MNCMSELFKVIFGNVTSVQLFGYVWFFIIGYLIYGLNETGSRDVYSKNTPVQWSWKFWFKDNWRRYLVTILCTYVLYMFNTSLSGNEFSNFDAVSLGLIGDGIGATLKNRTQVIGADRKKIMDNISNNEVV